MPDRRALLRTLPAIDRLLGSRTLSKLEETQPHLLILEAAQQVVDDLRQQLLRHHGQHQPGHGHL